MLLPAAAPVTMRLMPGETRSRAVELRALHRSMPVARYRSLVLHWMSRWLRPPRRAAEAPLPPVAAGQVAITFGGHATALVRYAGLTIAFDPMLGGWIKGVRRAVQPGITADHLADVGLVLISHRHLDHLHLPTLRMIPRKATVVVPPGAAAAISPLGFSRVVELAAGGDLALRSVQITAEPISHGEDPRARGLSYVLRGDGPSVFLCGDGGWFEGFADIGARHQPDIALLPIGGFVPVSFRDRHMSPLDALYAFEDLRARLMIPVHHGAFALSYERVAEPARWLAELVAERGLDAHVRILAPGESELFVTPGARHDAVARDPGYVGGPRDGGIGAIAVPLAAPPLPSMVPSWSESDVDAVLAGLAVGDAPAAAPP
jgi:L-ascorbate metabolism protein UlaG (beta-lactamase superfamily)